MANILLKHVQFIGFDTPGLEQGMDLAIDPQGQIEQIAFDIAEAPYEKVFDLSQHLLSPGWIDLHTHIYYGVSNLGVPPSLIGPATGVSVLVDAGTAGSTTFVGLRDYIITQHDFPIYAFLNVGTTGLILANQISELDSLDKLDLDGLLECIEQNRAYIKGVKLRASGVILRGWGYEVVKLGKR
ncbi:amidohydrolase/deacetylase family metallohydrolase, partial [candidate division KSB3 bacterium]|nr:amidohydrolase/deacetylase family metallohydrolase [candidate division KSB3 bacterium]MBD3327044.1 amidohydrolase/deacetylase family metallohydrolase [candidate division KSB3 bacterium]